MRIYTDFLRYTLEHTIVYLNNLFKYDLWEELKDEVELVMTYPNLWGKEQKQVLQKAAVQSGWISPPRCLTSLFFVEEAQAAARYCASHGGPDFKGFQVCCETEQLILL